jgi:hypothetical protein
MAFNIPHHFVVSSVYSLPKLAGQPPYLRHVAGAVTVFPSLDNSFSAINADQADVIGNPSLDTGRPRSQLLAQYFNTAAFARNAIGTFGTAPRNMITGPGIANLDLAVMKRFSLRETPAWNSGGDSSIA